VDHGLIGLAIVIVLGVAAQWVAWRIGSPSILMLLIFGFLAGPVAELVAPNYRLDPDVLFDGLLFPIVSLSVGLILYEGGLTLRFRELAGAGRAVRNLVTIGALVSWAGASFAAMLVFGLDPGLAFLLGAMLVVTGPTVVGPMLRHIRPSGAVGPILKWEGIVIDPIGALLAVLVYEVVLTGSEGGATAHVVAAISRTVLLSGGLGALAGLGLAAMLSRYWIPDELQNAVSVMLAVGVLAASNLIQHESGLLAVTVMGIVLANQKWADIEHIIEFKENLRVLLISVLFILLAARLELDSLLSVGAPGLLFVAILIFLIRPAAVLASSLGTKMRRADFLLLCWMAPRGIVAAAVSSLFATQMKSLGHENADLLASVTFLTIIATVSVYGLTGTWVARKLGVAESNPQGLLLVGAHDWARQLAELLGKRGITVRLIDSNRDNVTKSKLAGLDAYHGSALAAHTMDELELGGIGRMLAMTPNDWVNALTVQRFVPILGRASCYQLAPASGSEKSRESHKHLHGRWLFDNELSYWAFGSRVRTGHALKAIPLTDEFNYAAFCEKYPLQRTPLFLLDSDKRLHVIAAADPPTPIPGQTLIALIAESE
jgi:NhaP-type Na+/H+ or K+/H+ antiporter